MKKSLSVLLLLIGCSNPPKTTYYNYKDLHGKQHIFTTDIYKLKETDYLATSDNTMSDEMKAFRKSMRDIPQDYSSDKYDELLARNEQGQLTHSVWSKP